MSRVGPGIWGPWLLALTACSQPQVFELPEAPAEVRTLILVVSPEQIVEVLGLEIPPLPLSFPRDSEAHLIGYRTSLSDLQWRPGRLERPAPGEGVPLPESPWVWSLGRTAEPLDFQLLPDLVKQVALPIQPLRPCMSGGRCYEDEPGFCVSCAARAPLAPPERPEPPLLDPCLSGDRDADYRCLESGLVYAPNPGCVGLDTPSGCHPTTPCGFEPYQLGPQALWVAGSSALPAGAVAEADLDQALRVAESTTASVTIYLGRGVFEATRPLPAGVKLRGLCPSETIVRGPLLGPEAELSRVAWLAPGTIGETQHLTLLEVNLGEGSLLVEGHLNLQTSLLQTPVTVQGRAEFNTGRAEARLTVQPGALLSLSDLRVTNGADLEVVAGTVSLERLHFGPARPAIALLPGSTLSGRQLVLQGSLHADTRNSDVELSLEDVVINLPDGPPAAGIWADSRGFSVFQDDLGGCPRLLSGRFALRRVLVHEVHTQLEEYGADAVRLNCGQVEVEDLVVDGFGRGEALYLGMVDGTVARVLTTNAGIFEAADARPLTRADLDEWNGAGVRLGTPAEVDVILTNTISLADLTIYVRMRGLFVQGFTPTQIERVQVVRARGSGVLVQDREASLDLKDVESGYTVNNDGDSSLLGGHGLALLAEPPFIGGAVTFERFLSHHNDTAGLFMEGTLQRSSFRSGEMSDNGVGIEDLNGRDLSKWFQSVELKANQVPFGSPAE